MNKKFLALLAGAIVLAGCSIPGMGDDDTKPAAVAPISVEKLSSQSPEEQFYSLLGNSIKASNQKINEYLPSKETLIKGEGNLSLDLHADLSSQMGPGSQADLEVNISRKKDISNSKDPRGVVTLSAVLTSEKLPLDMVANADVQAEIRIVENSLFVSLQKADINISGIPAQIERVTKALVGNWYGDRFETLSGFTQGNLDVQKLIASKGVIIAIMEMMEQTEADPTKVYTFVKALPEKSTGDIKYFEVTVNPELSLQFVSTLVESFGANKEIQDKIKEDMTKNIEAQKNQIITLGFNPAYPLESYMEMPAFNFETGEAIEGKVNIFVYSKNKTSYELYVNATDSIKFVAENNVFSVQLIDENQTLTPLTGTYDTGKISFAVHENEKIIATGDFAKTGDTWAGSIIIKEESKPNIEIKISNASFSKQSVTVNAEVITPDKEGNPASMGTLVFKHTLEGIESLSVEKPADAQAFMNIAAALQPAPKAIEEAPIIEIQGDPLKELIGEEDTNTTLKNSEIQN